MARPLRFVVVLLVACNGAGAITAPLVRPPTFQAPRDPAGLRSYLVGTWIEVPEDREPGPLEAWRFKIGGRGDEGYSDGVFERGTFGADGFLVEPNTGPSGADYVLGWQLREGSFLHLNLDGAEEDMPLVVLGERRMRVGDRVFRRSLR